MSRNNLQVLYNVLEKEFSASEGTFLNAEKHRHALKEDFVKILETVTQAKTSLSRYPKAASLRRIGLIETLLKDLLLRHETERRHINALAFLISRLRSNLAQEILEPRLYGKIREALLEEEKLVHLREKFPDADAVPARPVVKRKVKTIRLALVKISGIHYAIPVTKIWKRDPQTLSYLDLKGQRRTQPIEEYFTPVEIPAKMFRQMAVHTPVIPAGSGGYRTQLQFYGRHFFLYGARLTYTVRTGGRTHTHSDSLTPQR